MNILTGKAKNFTGIYSDYYSVVYSTIYTRVRDKDLCADLAQEVFTRLLEKIDEVENPRAWLLGTLRYVLLEHYRKNSVENIDIDDIFYDTNIQYVNGFRDTRIILQDAFNASENYKDERDRIIYELIAIKNYTHEEVAGVMGLTRRQVSYKYKSVVDRIVDYLKKKGVANLEELL